MMKIAIYPGSFDPVTNGHTDIISRASDMFDILIVGVLNNSSKTPLFTVEERMDMLRMVSAPYSNVQVKSFDGLLVDFAHKENAKILVRGLRAVTDFEYELQLAQTNRVVSPDIDTIFLNTNLKYSYLSSSIVKEIASYGGNIDEFCDPRIVEIVKRKYNFGGNSNEQN